MFHFIWPSMLGLIPLAVAFGIARVLLRRYRREQLLRAWGHERHRRRFVLAQRSMVFKDIAVTLALCAASVALARPSLQSSTIEFAENNARVVAILDDSISMAARDSGDPARPQSRLKTACQATRQKIIPACRGNLFGLVTFAGQAYPQALPTRQLETAFHFLDTIRISDAPGEGSNVNGAFELAWRYFDELDKAAAEAGSNDNSAKKVIVFWSDGGTDEKFDLNAIVAGCNERNIQVLVYGVGDLQPVRIPVDELPRQKRILARGQFLEINGQVVETTLQEEPLMRLQEGTAAHGSRYQRVRTPADVQLERVIAGVEMVRRTGERELFCYPAAMFVLCVLAVPLLNRRYAEQREGREES